MSNDLKYRKSYEKWILWTIIAVNYFQTFEDNANICCLTKYHLISKSFETSTKNHTKIIRTRK